jgi:hypothetical protein
MSALNEDDDAAAVKRNEWWELAEAIHCDNASDLFTYMEQCRTVTPLPPSAAARDACHSNGDTTTPKVEEIYAMLHLTDSLGYDATAIEGTILVVAASFNRVAIARAILAINAANGVEWRSQQESALEAACANGHLEVARVIARLNEGQVCSKLNQSLALRYYCLAGDMEHAREVLASDSPFVTIKAALSDACRNGRCDIVALLTADALVDRSVGGYEAFGLA